MDKESGNFGLFLKNLSMKQLFVIASFHIVNQNGKITNPCRMKQMFDALAWGCNDFITKDQVDNKLEEVVDKNGSLTIHLNMSGKDKVMYDC